MRLLAARDEPDARADRQRHARYGRLAIDNVLSHPAEVAEVGALIEREPAVASVLLTIGAGVRLVVRGS